MAMIEDTNFSCPECGGPVVMISLDDEFQVPTHFTCCPECYLGNPSLNELPPPLKSPRVLLHLVRAVAVRPSRNNPDVD